MSKQTAMYDFAIHIRKMKHQLMREYQDRRADYYVVRLFEGLELKALGYLGQEKEQIEDAYMDAYGNSKEPEDYYNETYGNSNTNV